MHWHFNLGASWLNVALLAVCLVCNVARSWTRRRRRCWWRGCHASWRRRSAVCSQWLTALHNTWRWHRENLSRCQLSLHHSTTTTDRYDVQLTDFCTLWVRKKTKHHTLSLCNFAKFLTVFTILSLADLLAKFAIKTSLHIPPHLTCVATYRK